MNEKAFSPFPDIEAVSGSAMRASGAVGRRVYSSIPAKAMYPLIVFRRLGGQPTIRRRLDRARIQVDVWGNTKSEARDAAELARRALHEMEGQKFSKFSAFVTAVEDEIGLTFLPDYETSRDRYTFSVLVSAHHHESA